MYEGDVGSAEFQLMICPQVRRLNVENDVTARRSKQPTRRRERTVNQPLITVHRHAPNELNVELLCAVTSFSILNRVT